MLSCCIFGNGVWGYGALGNSVAISSVGGEDRGVVLIKHVEKCIERATLKRSKLPSSVLKLEGYSSVKVRHFLNNLCSLPNTSYLEIGVWKGSTFISALYGNQSTVIQAIGIDNWSKFGGPYTEFKANVEKYISNINYEFYSEDSFKFDIQKISQPVNVYFYDGDHSALSQEMAFTYFNDVLDDVFIAVVDDWNFPAVPEGTHSAFEKLNYEVLFEKVLPAKHNRDINNWWNGLYVAVIRKNVEDLIED